MLVVLHAFSWPFTLKICPFMIFFKRKMDDSVREQDEPLVLVPLIVLELAIRYAYNAILNAKMAPYDRFLAPPLATLTTTSTPVKTGTYITKKPDEYIPHLL
jgi:hypothetical protein